MTFACSYFCFYQRYDELRMFALFSSKTIAREYLSPLFCSKLFVTERILWECQGGPILLHKAKSRNKDLRHLQLFLDALSWQATFRQLSLVYIKFEISTIYHKLLFCRTFCYYHSSGFIYLVHPLLWPHYLLDRPSSFDDSGNSSCRLIVFVFAYLSDVAYA